MSKPNIGLSVSQGIAAGRQSYREPSKRNIGLLMVRERGVPNKAYRIQSPEDDFTFFGGPTNGAYGYHVVKSLFDNAAPATATIYGVRIVGAGSVAANDSITVGTVDIDVTAAFQGEDDPGTWGNSLSVIIYSYNSKARDGFYAEVFYKGQAVEYFEAASCAALQLLINRGSQYVKISFSGELPTLTTAKKTGTITTSTSSNTVTGVGTSFTTDVQVGTVLYNEAGDSVIGTVLSIQSDTSLTLTGTARVAVSGEDLTIRVDSTHVLNLTGGTSVAPVEADAYPGADPNNPKGFAVFGGLDVQIIAHTDFHTLSMAVKGKEFAEENNMFYVFNLPLLASEGLLELYADTLQAPSIVPCAGYPDWDTISDENGNELVIPAIGRILGAAYLRTPYLQGDHIHIPPAGVDSAAKNVIRLASGKYSQAQINKFVEFFSVNPSYVTDVYGMFTLTSRTYSTHELYKSIHIIMQANYYLRFFRDNMGFLLQKPNTPELKQEAKAFLISFGRLEYEKGALERAVSFEESWNVICDITNNPLNQDRRLLNIDIEYIPTEATEKVRIRLNRNDALLTTKVN